MKKLLATFLCLIMVVVFMPTMASAETSGYVTVEITINPEYESTGRDAAARIALANAEFDDEQFPTLKAAADAVHKLYSRAQDGTYTSTTYGYTNANPLYYTASGLDPQRLAEWFSLSAVKYIVHGTVPSGDPANGINVTGSSDAMYAAVSDIQVVGVDNATITDCKGIYANVAGGYDRVFVKTGTLLVKGINFTNTTGSTGITANGQANATGSHADETNTIVEDCSFKNMLYTYLNDHSTTAPDYTIKNCTFDGSEAEKNYAIFIQPDNEDYVQTGKTVITGNTISNYMRAINIQDRPVGNR